jgi:hypothetical protein
MANHSKPVLGKEPQTSILPVNNQRPSAEFKWSFSFRFWRQIEYFGLNRTDSRWFVSLLERLQTLSEEGIDTFLIDSGKKKSYRYHEINWSQKNIPIQRKDFNWLSKDYLNNEDEYPFVQFQVSKALGRIVGFFDENRIFNILLLDPLHNIQPSSFHNYRVDPCYPLTCYYSLLIDKVDGLVTIKSLSGCKTECDLFRGVQNIREGFVPVNIVMLSVDDVDIKDADALLSNGHVKSYAEIFQTGIVYSVKDSDQSGSC